MSIRVLLLSCFVAAVSVYAFRDWFKSLCGLILLMAVIEHPDMPKSIMGIQGLNPWNIMMVFVLAGWLLQRPRERHRWDMPRPISILLLLYLLVVLVGFVRMITDRSHIEEMTTGYLISEKLINTLKWVIPGLLMFDGARTRGRVAMGIACSLGVFFLLAVQVAKWMPPSSAMSGDDLDERSQKILLNEVGFHRVNMSMMLSGASWAILATMPLVRRRSVKAGIVIAALVAAYGQALTGGRMGYVTWGMVGLLMCIIKWRKFLLVAPLVPIAVVILLPGVAERMLMGFGAETPTGQEVVDDYEVTAGRTLIWPYVIDEIIKSPLFGHGRLAMKRTGLADYLMSQYSESFPHPHNAYLQLLLDNGMLGFLIVMPFYALVMIKSIALFRDTRDPIYEVTGGVACALVLALLVAAMGSQSFYPREGAVGMWCAIGLTFRMSIERARASVVWFNKRSYAQPMLATQPWMRSTITGQRR